MNFFGCFYFPNGGEVGLLSLVFKENALHGVKIKNRLKAVWNYFVVKITYDK